MVEMKTERLVIEDIAPGAMELKSAQNNGVAWAFPRQFIGTRPTLAALDRLQKYGIRNQ